MEKENQRLRRENAGVHRNLSTNFTWPRGFGTKSVTDIGTIPVIISGGAPSLTNTANLNMNIAQPPVIARTVTVSSDGKSDMGKSMSKMELSESNRSHASKSRKSTRTRSSSASLNLQKKRLAIETEKERQDLETREREIDNRMKLLQMEHELKEAALEVSIDEGTSTASEIELRSKAESDHHDFIAEWVDKVEPTLDVPDEITGNTQETQTDVRMLCQTISNLLKTVTPSGQDKILARHIVDKDFPVFDGNPEDWPLFHQRFCQICKMCDYSKDEILVKLQKCLRGEAKSAVAGMLLTSDNVNLIMDTLQLRFGRPEFIIEVMISRIRTLVPIRETNIEKLVHFSNEVQNLVSTMKSLVSEDYLRNPQLLRDLLGKLPDILKLKWGEVVMKTAGRTSLEDFSEWIGDIALAASYVSSPKVPVSNDLRINDRRGHQKKTHSVLSMNDISRKATCSYCGETHSDNSCSKLNSDDVETRWKVVTDKKLCFSCLKKKHHMTKCRKRQECKIDGCKYFHHELLHKNFRPLDDSSSRNDTQVPAPVNESLFTMKDSSKKVLLRMIPVKLFGPNGFLETIAILDEASTVTLLDSDISRELGLQGERDALCLQWTNEIVSRLDESERVSLQISGIRPNSKKFTLNNVRTVDKLLLPAQTILMEDWNTYGYLKNLPIDDIMNQRPMILIGQNNISLTVPRQVRIFSDSLPIATKCKLGWSLHGPVSGDGNDALTLHICNTQENDESINNLIKQYFSTESFGVAIPVSTAGKDEKLALDIMRNTAKRVGNRYEIGLLWKEADIKLPESRSNALHRLQSLEKKLKKDEVLAQEYCKKIESYAEKGYVRKLTPEEADIETPRTWYIPHFAVKNPNKPGKVRLVFDAAAKSRGRSLNDNLLPGPDLLQPLVAVIWKFRERKYGFCGDIREMFHQVQIREADRCSQRFLWRGINYSNPPEVFEMQVMTFGATCSPACAQFIKNLSVKENASSEKVYAAIVKKFYVDDYLDSTDTEEEAVNMVHEVHKTLEKGGFQIVNWISNSTLLKSTLSEEMLQTKSLDDGMNYSQRVLGIWWNSRTDEIEIKLNENVQSQNCITKRLVLRFIMSIYDPLGIIAFLTIRGKILLQDIWRTGIGWDSNLPDSLMINWQIWLGELQTLKNMRIPRCYSTRIPSARKLELHTFCDASEKAFAAVSYLRVVGEEIVDVALISAKTRVAPLKPLSIPRLELQAAVMASRLAASISEHLDIRIDQHFYWSDSKCVLLWIRSDGRTYKQFVAHRIGEIQETTDVGEWRWVPSNLNVADMATKSTMNSEGEESRNIWLYGPKFLRMSSESWPAETNSKTDDSYDGDLEKKAEFVAVIMNYDDFLPDVNRFSKWKRLIRTTGWIIRFFRILMKKIGKNDEDIDTFGLSVAELSLAERFCLKRSQSRSFPEEIEKLKNLVPLNKQSRLKALCPMLNTDGLLVLGGRTNLAGCMESSAKNPYILSPKDRYTKLLLLDYHEKFHHQGVESILTDINIGSSMEEMLSS